MGPLLELVEQHVILKVMVLTDKPIWCISKTWQYFLDFYGVNDSTKTVMDIVCKENEVHCLFVLLSLLHSLKLAGCPQYFIASKLVVPYQSLILRTGLQW